MGAVDWYQKLDSMIRKEWIEWRKDASLLSNLKFQRCYRSNSFGEIANVTLHCFSDASFIGYGVACYLRYVDTLGNVEVNLVMGKSRVTPLKPTTVARLETTAASVSAKYGALIRTELEMENCTWLYFEPN